MHSVCCFTYEVTLCSLAFNPDCTMQNNTLHAARHCSTQVFTPGSTLEKLSSNPADPAYFYTFPVPWASPQPQSTLLLPHASLQPQQPLATSGPLSIHGAVNLAAYRWAPGLGPHHGNHSLGCEPRIGRRAAAAYRIDANRWTAEAMRRWGARDQSFCAD